MEKVSQKTKVGKTLLTLTENFTLILDKFKIMPGSESPAPPNIRLIYFDIRGFAEPLRYMLKMAKEDFVDERIPLDAWAGRRKRSSIESLKKEKDSEKRRKSKEYGATLESKMQKRKH